MAEMNVIEPLHFTEGVQTIYLGQKKNYIMFQHWVQLDFAPSPVNNNSVLATAEINLTLSKEMTWRENPMHTWESIGKNEKLLVAKRKLMHIWENIGKRDQTEIEKITMLTWKNIELRSIMSKTTICLKWTDSVQLI